MNPRIAEAQTRDDVVSACNDYLASWQPERLARLPGHCRPKPMLAADDVTLFAATLALESANREERGEAILPELRVMRQFFDAADEKLRKLDPRRNVDAFLKVRAAGSKNL
jgi:hypothetical protein